MEDFNIGALADHIAVFFKRLLDLFETFLAYFQAAAEEEEEETGV